MFTIQDTQGHSLTLKASQIMRRRKWRLQNLPLVDKPPYCLDLGLETHEVEVTVHMYESQYKIWKKFTSPIEVVSSTYPDLPATGDASPMFPGWSQNKAWYRIEQERSTRKGGWVKRYEVVMVLMRDYWK